MGHEEGWFDWYVFNTFVVARHGDQAYKVNERAPANAADWECPHGALAHDGRKPPGCRCWEG